MNKKFIKISTAALAVCWLSGCETTGLSPREDSASYSNYILGLPPAQPGVPKKIDAPIRLAVAQIGEPTPAGALLDKLAGNKALIASVSGLPFAGDAGRFRARSETDYTSRVNALCALARSTGADYLLLLGGNVDASERRTALSVLDFTIVGAAIVPATRIDIEGRGAATLIQTATAEPVFLINTTAKSSASTPAYLADGKTTSMTLEMRDKLIDNVADKFLIRLNEAKAIPTAAR